MPASSGPVLHTNAGCYLQWSASVQENSLHLEICNTHSLVWTAAEFHSRPVVCIGRAVAGTTVAVIYCEYSRATSQFAERAWFTLKKTEEKLRTPRTALYIVKFLKQPRFPSAVYVSFIKGCEWKHFTDLFDLWQEKNTYLTFEVCIWSVDKNIYSMCFNQPNSILM